jgi:hypothetical protein
VIAVRIDAQSVLPEVRRSLPDNHSPKVIITATVMLSESRDEFRHWCLNWESSVANGAIFGDATGGLEGAQIGGTMRV